MKSEFHSSNNKSIEIRKLFRNPAMKSYEYVVSGIHIYINFENASEFRFSLMIAFFR